MYVTVKTKHCIIKDIRTKMNGYYENNIYNINHSELVKCKSFYCDCKVKFKLEYFCIRKMKNRSYGSTIGLMEIHVYLN